ncbi:MAG: hypothetical protein JWR60_2743 [Polaromonas sp.]|nr:hypothetical protein [Polaromonas sp.]
MFTSSRKQLNCRTSSDLLDILRTWFMALGVVMLALAVMAVRNTVGNPETWASAFHAFAASGAFVQYAGWLAAIGVAFLVIALFLTLCLARIR